MNSLLKATVKVANKNRSGRRVLAFHLCARSHSGNASACDVPGLSKKVVDVPSKAVGFPGASKEAEYKNPEYYCYNNVSYFEAEVEMLKFRLPQPSNKPKK